MATRVRLRGTRAATGTPVTITEIQMCRTAGVTIAERWYAIDRSGLPR